MKLVCAIFHGWWHHQHQVYSPDGGMSQHCWCRVYRVWRTR